MSGKFSAFLLGGTGQVGKAISKELAKSESFDKVTLFTRRQVDPSQGDTENDYSKFTVKIVDFDKLVENHSKDFEGYDVGFCSMGLNGGTMEEKKKVDRDYVVAAVKLAKAGGCTNFNLVSGNGANKDAYLTIYKNKGLVEQDVTEVGFDRVAFYRARLLVGGESRDVSLVKTLDCWRRFSCEIPVLAKVMVHNSLQPPKAKVDIYENHDIHKLGIEFTKPKK
ncbi:unnamed protein product [Allacma fusca]|uniref:Protein HTATIP2 n=1 Tax=Allacma fusca TaxID=39272 RepID=A0A8J2JK10_9HEXA|nr:unnamed protein product [Allacma fusca]